MRIFVLLIAALSLPAVAAEAPDSLATTSRLASNGALQLALARIELMQPAQTSAPRWADWEMLRVGVLAQLDRPAQVLQRVAALPSKGLPDGALPQLLLLGAQAAVKLSQGRLARSYAARLLWQVETNAEEYRQARLVVIESYFADKLPEEAYRSMLRFQLDFQPLDRQTATRFVEALLTYGLERETVNWLAQVDESSALRILLRLKTGLITADVALAQARAALAKNNTIVGWKALLAAAAAQNNLTQQIEAQENIVALVDPGSAGAYATELWRLYAAAAQELANRNHLLTGDDTGWADFAARQLAQNAQAARAYFAWLALSAGSAAARHHAQLQLALALQAARLEITALRLFKDSTRIPVSALDTRARFVLGAIAADNGDNPEAARLWTGLGVPADLSADEWQLRLAAVLFRAGMADAGSNSLRRLTDGRSSMPASILQRAVALAQELLDASQVTAAEQLFTALLPLADAAQRRDILFALGRAAEARADYRGAGDYFLQAATLIDGRSSDALAQSARLRSAANLARAGLREDARAQYQWLLKMSKDAGQAEAIRRELSRL